ncbi:MAG: RHS repeat-associated core domain-containing protein [Plesiomonas sp.]
MHSNNTTLFAGTPDVTVLDNRGLSVRDIRYHRHPDTLDLTDERITRYVFTALSHLQSSTDPRLHASGVNNVEYQTTLSGQPLFTSGVDNGATVTLNDIAGRPSLGISATGVIRTWQYEDETLPGRPLSLTERAPNEGACITERFIWASNSLAEQNLNLAGQCLRHYDTAGLSHIDSVGLTGAQLSVSRQLLQEDVEADWQSSDESTWQNMLVPEVFTTQTTVDATGAVLTTTDAKGNVQHAAYDVAGLLSGSWLTLKGGIEQVIVKSLTYSAAGQKLREEHGNGVVTSYSYEPETQRLIGIKTERPAGHAAGSKVLQNLRYEYDPVGNVLKISNDAEEARFWRNQKVVPENTYTYDSLYQLVSATGREMANAGQQGSTQPSPVVPLPTDSSAYTNYTRTYAYDNAGNLTQIRHSSPATGNNYTTNITISDRSNRGVLSTLTHNPADVDALFTAGGQQRQLQPGQNLVWTPRNELLKVTPVMRDGATDDGERYRYDSSSQRILKVSTQKTNNSTQTQRVVYLPGLELRSTKNGSTETEILHAITIGEAGRAQLRVLHWESGKPADISNDQMRYSYDNLIGSSGLELDQDGNVISQEEYYPYGGTAIWSVRSQIEAGYKTVRYSGKERDATGLYYYGYRYYQPWVGRWLSADPAGTVDGLNLFRMVWNNPVTFFDSDGLVSTGQEARQRVANEFVLSLHMPVFERISIENNMAMSVREAGTYTISALREGAAAKGHNILEKTIKPSSLKSAYGKDAGSVLALAESSGLVGRVGQWGKSGVRGIYAHNAVSRDDRSYSISLRDKQEGELVNAWIKRKIIIPYTGDYDMHDIIQYHGNAGVVPIAESHEEKNVKDMINHGVADVDPLRPFNDTSMNVIRHGPQVNFVPYMWEFEHDKVMQDNGYLSVVAKPGPFPVAMVHQGEWSILDNAEELFSFYKSTNTPLPEHWAQPFLDRGNGMVATPKHARILDQTR